MADIELVVFETPVGEIAIELDVARAPVTAAHFKALILQGWLEGGHFYRTVHKAVTPGHLPTIDVLQGGLGFFPERDVPSVMHEPTDRTGLRHVEGTVSLARGADKPATGEFFICLGAFPVLDAGTLEGAGAAGFSAFGQVVRGMDVVRKIHAMPAEAPPPDGWEILKGQFLSEPVPFKARNAAERPERPS